jgi:hypothetical protein
MVPPYPESTALIGWSTGKTVQSPLAARPESERRAIVQAADEEARRRARAVASWATIESLTGLVHIGGDAVEDCRRADDR